MMPKLRHAATGLALLCVFAAPGQAADYLGDARSSLASGDLGSARLQLRNAIRSDPKSAAGHYLLGRVNLQLGDASAAEKEAQSAQDLGYDPVATRTLLIGAYLGAGRYRDLLRDFPAQAGTPELTAATLVGRGRAQLFLDHPDEAEASFAQARKLAPGAIDPLLAEAQLALARRDLATASDRIDAALKIDPRSAEALQRQAVVLAERGDQAGALAASNNAVAAAPGQYSYRLERAGMLVAFGKNAEARTDVDVVLAQAPGNVRAVYYRAVLAFRAGQYAAADADLEKLSNFISQSPGGYYVVALVKQKLGQTEQALDAAARYVGRNPGDAQGALLLAELQIQAGRPGKAAETLLPLSKAATANAAVYDLLGAALTRLGRLPEALAEYQKALALRPDDPGLLARGGAAQLALNHPDEAAGLLERSVKLAPDQPQAQTLLAMALLDAGRIDQAQRWLDDIKGKQGDTETVGLLAGGVQLARFQLDEARQAFEAVLRAHPDSVPARLSLARVALLQQREADWIRLLGEVLQREPAREAAVNDVVNAMLRQNKPAEAAAVLERAHAAAPANPRFLSRLAGLYIGRGEPQKALALTQPPEGAPGAVSPAAPGPLAIASLLVRAEAQIALKQPDAAQQSYRGALGLDRGLVFARLQLLRLLLAGKDPATAQAVLQDGLLVDPQSEPLLKAAVELEAGADFNAALASAAKLDRDPRHQPASAVLQGDLYMSAKRYDEALAAYTAAAKRASSPRLALRLADAHAAAGHVELAAQGLREWLTRNPGDLDVATALSDFDITARRLDSAKALLSEVVAKRPEDAKSLNNLAWVSQQQHDPRAAVLAQRAYQLAPGPQTADTWGYIMATEGGGDRGVSLLRTATAQAPDDLGMTYHLVVAYRAAGQPAEALKLLTALTAKPGDFPEKAQARQLLASLSGKP